MSETSTNATNVSGTSMVDTTSVNPFSNILLTVLLLITVGLIYADYQTPLTGNTFLTNIYLYIIFGLLFIAFVSNFTQLSQITAPENLWKMVLLYFIMAFGGMSIMAMGGLYVSHIGFLLMLVGISLLIGSVYRYGTNIAWAAIVTAIIMGALTVFVFMSSEQTIMSMKNWAPYLLWILLGVIVIQLIMIIFKVPISNELYNIMNILIIILFVFFILSDTSRILVKSKDLKCETHTCVNYPMESTSLILDYLNIFIRLVKGRK